MLHLINSMINVGGMVRYVLHKDIRKKFTYTSFSQFCLYVCNTYDSHEGRTAFLVLASTRSQGKE